MTALASFERGSDRAAPVARRAFMAAALVALSGLIVAGCTLPSRPPTPREEALRDLEANPTAQAEEALVVINGEELTRGDFFRRVLAKAGKNALERQIVDDELFRQKAAELDIAISQEDAQLAAEAYLEGMARQRGGRAELERAIESQGLAFTDFRSDIVPQVRSELVRMRVTMAMRDIGEDALREYYDRTYRHKRFLVRHIAYGYPTEGKTEDEKGRLALDAFEKARRAAERVRAGHDFAEIARAESDDAMTAQQGGALPPILEDDPDLPPEFKEAIFSLEVGGVSDPIENPRTAGFHVFQLTDVMPSQSWVDCVDTMRAELRESEPSPAEVARVLVRLREDAVIEWPGS